jgi:hypothetical protein
VCVCVGGGGVRLRLQVPTIGTLQRHRAAYACQHTNTNTTTLRNSERGDWDSDACVHVVGRCCGQMTDSFTDVL